MNSKQLEAWAGVLSNAIEGLASEHITSDRAAASVALVVGDLERCVNRLMKAVVFQRRREQIEQSEGQ